MLSRFTPLRLARGGIRCFAVQSSQQADELITYARSSQGDTDEVRDILRQAIGTEQPKGLHVGRLLLALADVESRSSDWAKIAQLAETACEATKLSGDLSDSDAVMAAEVRMEANWMQTRAHITMGLDTKAAQIAEEGVKAVRKLFFQSGAELRRWQALTLANSAVAALQHATGDLPGADATTAAVTVLSVHGREHDGIDEDRDKFLCTAFKQEADLRAAQGQLASATKLYKEAALAAESNLESSRGSSGVLESPVHLGEVMADALLGSAQLSANAGRYDEAEAALARALAAAEAIGGDQHARVAMVLLVFGRVYASTARVSYAEGLYREAVKRLGVDQDVADDGKLPKLTVHPSVAALLSWRYCQLLTVLPKRSTEADSWQQRARGYYQHAAGLNNVAIERYWGNTDALKQSGGQPGLGVVLNLTLRRALPVAP